MVMDFARRVLTGSALIMLLAPFYAPVLAQNLTPVNGSPAIQGYDPVAYFTQSTAVKGQPAFSHQWNGTTWHFATAANRDAFAAAPEKYAPQYGGYCAYAVSQGYTAKIDPEAWSVVDGRLYLNYSMKVRTRWEQDKAGYIKSGDVNWPKLLGTRDGSR